MTTITALLTREQLVDLSISLCNGHWGWVEDEGETLDCEHVWMSPLSIGGREIYAGDPTRVVEFDAGCGAIWEGFDPSQVSWAQWTSATSGATIVATRTGNNFEVVYASKSSRAQRESRYLSTLLRVDPRLVSVDRQTMTVQATRLLDGWPVETEELNWRSRFSDRELALMGE